MLGDVSYVGNLSCRDCGLTFTSRWGSVDGADEYRCERDHVAFVDVSSGRVVAFEAAALDGGPGLEELRGLCPRCSTELATGLLPSCPVCGGRDHDILLDGTMT
jgi:hypothetical protein